MNLQYRVDGQDLKTFDKKDEKAYVKAKAAKSQRNEARAHGDERRGGRRGKR